ncbi:MAG TPA: SDR family oxidoreductase [Gaiellaceae bacterium]|nr:SDR family oxidoreductase [Gaiellaceae bacterium]
MTGAARGIGRAIAERLAEDGHEVLLVDLDDDELERVCAISPSLHPFAGDVCDSNAIAGALQAAHEVFGAVGILVNNAGVPGRNAPIEEQTDDDWARTLDVLLTAPFRWSRAIVPEMRREGWGRIVNIASVAGKEGNPNLLPYSVAKAGVICMGKALAREVADAGILVNSVAPGVVETDLLKSLTEQQVEYMLSRIPLRRPGTVDEVAAAVAFLVGEATFTTAQTIDLSGGRCSY